jgi:hypothetical protein
MANESAMRERGWPEPRRQQYRNHAGENPPDREPEIRKALTERCVLLRSSQQARRQAEARIVLSADNRSVSAARADQVAQSMPCEFLTSLERHSALAGAEQTGAHPIAPSKSQGSS